MTIGERLLKLRKEKNLSQEELANVLNVSRQTISKWETDQTSPDFDKIIPICEFYGITCDELFKGAGESVNCSVSINYDRKKKSAINIGVSVFLYIISVVWIIIAVPILKSPMIGVCIFLVIIAIATGIIVYNSILNSKEKRVLTKEEKLVKQINEIISMICVVIYFIVSFTTMAWHITWVIFLINGLLETVVKLVFELKGSDKNEEK